MSVIQCTCMFFLQETLSERLKKHGEATPLGLFIRSETSLMSAALSVIIAELQVHTLSFH